jgi:small subunit ribosomal protein S5
LELAGIRDIRTKCLRSNNPRNVVSATIEGLKSLMSLKEAADKRGKTPAEIVR